MTFGAASMYCFRMAGCWDRIWLCSRLIDHFSHTQKKNFMNSETVLILHYLVTRNTPYPLWTKINTFVITEMSTPWLAHKIRAIIRIKKLTYTYNKYQLYETNFATTKNEEVIQNTHNMPQCTVGCQACSIQIQDFDIAKNKWCTNIPTRSFTHKFVSATDDPRDTLQAFKW